MDTATSELLVNAPGSVGARLLEHNMDVGCLRPFLDGDGQTCITVNEQGKPVSKRMITNAPALLRYNEWERLDNAVVNGARERLKIVQDLRSQGLVYPISEGMGKSVLVTQKASETTGATTGMDPLVGSDEDRQEFGTDELPLFAVWKDFKISLRELSVGRTGGSPLDVSMAEQCGRRVAEMLESITCGTAASTLYTFGTRAAHGITNFPNRNTKSLTDPTGTWEPKTLVTEVLDMKNISQQDGHYGPWQIYNGAGWDVYLDADYSDAKGDNTLRDRLNAIEGIQGCTTLDKLGEFDLVLVQMTSNTIRMADAVDITTLQWEEMGGMLQRMKVLAIMVPQVRADFEDKCGIVHGSVA